jgi:hypothetical protein
MCMSAQHPSGDVSLSSHDHRTLVQNIIRGTVHSGDVSAVNCAHIQDRGTQLFDLVS